MSILIFIVGIVALIVVHEFGHFVAAKLSKMRVDEFGLGYPPRAAVIGHMGETILSLNWLPFGGFVKIFGEDVDSENIRDVRSFSSKNRFKQALVLVAGITMNLLFSYVLITGALIAGTPRALAPDEIANARDIQLAVAGVLPSSPAAEAGLLPGDIILSAEDGHYVFDGVDSSAFTKFIVNGGGNTTIALSVQHASGVKELLFARPVVGIINSDLSRPALGVEVATIGVVPLSFNSAIVEGVVLTWGTIKITAAGLLHFFYGIFTLRADLTQVSGPIGIVGVVGDASVQGFGNLLSIMAIISINLALINLIPIPALDGGRLLFVIIESVIRRPIKPSVARAVNAAGFAFLVLLMLAVTAHDIFKIIS